MRPYEQILSKISPTFYKLIVYENDFDRYANTSIISSYLEKAKLPKMYYVDLPLDWLDSRFYSMRAIESTKYFYYIGAFALEIKGINKYIKNIMINEKYKSNLLRAFVNINSSELIVSMVINKFSFENERITNPPTQITYKDLFIVLVGKDIYDTIRENIK